MNSSFFRRKIISQENKIVQKFLKDYKSDEKIIQLSNKLKNLKNVNQGNFYLIFFTFLLLILILILILYLSQIKNYLRLFL